MHWTTRFMVDGPSIAAGSSTIPIAVCNTCPFAIASDLLGGGFKPSVESVGDGYDITLAETINCLDKADLIHWRRLWRNAKAVQFATLEWVDWFNRRAHSQGTASRSRGAVLRKDGRTSHGRIT
jgi:hypothetical protein